MQNQENKKFNLKLNDLRDKIDQIDNNILNLLIQRAQIVAEVKDLKEDFSDKFFVKSAREADMIKDLIKRSEGKIPEQLIKNIWRKIISFSNYFEQQINIAIHNPEKNPKIETLLRGYYNELIPLTEFENSTSIFNEIESGKQQIAFFHLPKQSDNSDWWIKLANNRSGIRVFLNLKDEKHNLVAVAIKEDEKSYHDKSLLVIEQSCDYSESSLSSALSDNFDDFRIISSAKSGFSKDNHFFLVEVDGFISENDQKIENLSKIPSKPYVKILGVYPG